MHIKNCHTTIQGAICRQTDGSRTDGKKWAQLPLSVMRFDENLTTVNHSKVTTNSNWFAELFLTDYCKALSRAFNCNGYFHKNEVIKAESKERLEKEYSTRLTTNGAFTHKEINVPLFLKHESLPSLDLNYHYNNKIK